MYEKNYLVRQLRAASIGREDAVLFQNYDNGNTQSYGVFFANSERMASLLVAKGVLPGDRVAVQAPKTQAMLELYVGTVMAGAVFLPLNTGYTDREIEYFLKDAEPALLICDPDNLEHLSQVAAVCNVSNILTLAENETGSLVDLRDQQLAGFEPVERKGDDLAAILYTSGTTGRSKGAMLTHRALASNAQTLKEVWAFTRDDVLIHALPIFHTHGLFVATNISLVAGSSCIFMSKFEPEAIVGEMKNATVLMGVPTFYVRLLKSNNLASAAKNMRLFVSGSAPLLEETHTQWSRVTGHDILERYGMTETNMNTSNPYDGERRAGTVGFALPGVEVEIRDSLTGLRKNAGEVGVLEVRGSNVFAGYWRMPEKSAEELRENGFFITGDMAKIDTDGYIHIVGRAKDMIISGGYNVYPREVEGVIDELDGVVESAVIGIGDEDFGEVVMALVVLEPNTKLSQAEILALISTQIARYKQPRLIEFITELPRNSMGKVQKNTLRARYDKLFKTLPV